MKSRILMALVVLAFAACIACGADETAMNVISEEDMVYEEIRPSQGFSEEEKKQIINEYMENMFAKDIMKNKGVLGCKVSIDIDKETDTENSVTVQYFYDSEIIEDVASLEDSIEQLILSNLTSAEVVYVRGTPLLYMPEEDADIVGENGLINNLPADLEMDWNYIPVPKAAP